ncbi:hypothetical protein A2442_00045 [Candidatus Campbellbacteria bacterium RIFOXYC2_FULL_35_25]|uniref:Uncharacterized protein n=1 Tax=Candidatus Campbellbacteria bacterium RIFOXYC2_FULL_35_25 TaxID=1797582 RepID=A0A1F5EHU4_9BACT|nr:MAG: hypothetical protein A2442_00045 [Candidatus Campbellbacteria bacterium RIFOXYC2_FULL_35_25]
MNKILKNILIIIPAFFLKFGVASAFTYTLLEPSIPGLNANVNDLGDYLSVIYNVSIGSAMVLAVLMISIGGFKYITEESFTGKAGAKDTIKNALIGLLLILSSYLLLQTINPDLVGSSFAIPHTDTF